MDSRLSALVILIVAIFLIPSQGWATPQIESWSTEKGAKVMYVYAPDLPMVDVRMIFDAGSARDDGKPGLASLTNTLLNDGADKWDANQLAEQFEDIGAGFVTQSLRDMSVVSLRTLTEPDVLKRGLEAITAVVTKPRFDAEEIERRRQQVLIALQQQQQDAGSVASKAFYKAIYAAHPYGHDPAGNDKSISAITAEDIQGFFSSYYVAANLVIAIVGDVDRQQAETIVERITADMPIGEKAAALPKVVFKPSGVEKVNFPSSQTHLYLGQPGMSRDDPDYFPLYVGNHILGGSGLVSMLSDEVREKRGLSYSVYSYFLPMREQGPFMMVAQTRNDRANQTLDVMQRTLQDFISKGPSAELLEASKKNITGGFPLRVASNSKIVEYIAMMGFYDYPLDYLETFVSKVEAVTTEDIQSAFSRRLFPPSFVTILVGGTSQAGAE